MSQDNPFEDETKYRVVVNFNGSNGDFTWTQGEPIELPESLVDALINKLFFVDEEGNKIADPRK